MARPERFELPTLCFEGRCSIQLSYGRVFFRYLNLARNARFWKFRRTNVAPVRLVAVSSSSFRFRECCSRSPLFANR
jgi:hypothetical protein